MWWSRNSFFQLPTHAATNQETNWHMASETVPWTTKEQYQVNIEIKFLQEIAENWETFLFFAEIFERLSWRSCSQHTEILKEMHKAVTKLYKNKDHFPWAPFPTFPPCLIYTIIFFHK